MADPIDEFLTTKEATRQAQRGQELEHLKTWRASGKPEHLEPLLKAFEPLIGQKMRQWRAPTVPEAAFKAELQKHLIGAFETFDPNRGAQLATHVENRLRKAQRYNAKYQNMGYIPEGKSQYIGKVQRAQDELAQDYGRDPTHQEIADHLRMPTKQVSAVINAQRKDVPASSFETDPSELEMHRGQEVLDLLEYNLTPEENTVFKHLLGKDGHQKLTATDALARKLGKSSSQISRVRSSILKKFQAYK